MSSTDRIPVDRKGARRFGLGALGVALLIATWLMFKKHHPRAAVVAAGLGVALALLGVLAPRVILLIRRGWMVFAHGLGWVNSRIILSVIFFGLLTPFALFRRLFVRDPLETKWSPRATGSFWHRKEPVDPKHYERPS